MVNTFLTSESYKESASNLDKSRLWKQILEALQILDLIKSYHFLGKLFKSPCPKNPYLVKEWTKNIMKSYKQLDSYIFLHQGKYVYYPKKNEKPKKIKYDEKYEILENGNILYKDKTYKKYSLVLPGDRFMSMGFCSHPVIVMWLNHEDSLKLYINAHLDVFLARGGKEGTKVLKFNIDNANIEHPIWTKDSMFHINHRAALLTKEIERKEKSWYINKQDFKIAYKYYKDHPPQEKTKSTSSFEYYIWPFTQDVKNPRYIVNDDNTCSFRKESNSKNLQTL